MRRVRRLQLKFGALWGAIAYAAGWLITWYVLGPEQVTDHAKWKVVSWFHLGANFVDTVHQPVGALATISGAENIITDVPSYGYLQGVPIALCLIAGLLISNTLGYTKRLQYLVENGVAITVGYASTGLIVMYISDARPGIEALVLAFAVGFGALYIGGTVISQFSGSLPFIGVASLGTVVLVGLLVIMGGVVLVDAIWTLFAIPIAGGVASAVLLKAARELE